MLWYPSKPPTGHKWAGPWMISKVNNKTCVIVSRLDKDGTVQANRSTVP